MISVKDNDSLAARLATDMNADLLMLLSDVEGLYTSPPGTEGSRLMHTYSPAVNGHHIVFGDDHSRVGTGGMESKVSTAAKSGLFSCITSVHQIMSTGCSFKIVTDVGWNIC